MNNYGVRVADGFKKAYYGGASPRSRKGGRFYEPTALALCIIGEIS